MKTARILLSAKCNRTCHYCCNEQDGTLDDAVPLHNLDILQNYKSVCITGGEPMMYPDRVIALANAIKAVKDMPIYMYSATYTKRTEDVLQSLDGITFTMHEEASLKDVVGFDNIQELAHKYPELLSIFVNPSKGVGSC
jgi:organic radical activating enzyme